MTTTINASNSGGGGLVQTADASGVLALQTAGTTAVTIDASQRTAFVAGTAALPAITTTGDTNTGIFFPAADTIAFSEGGAEAMRIDSSGNVGIGTTSPTNGKLVITGNSVTTAQGIRLTGDSADARFICESATLGAGILGTFSTHAQLFYTDSTERMRITSGGQALIGATTANSSQSKLELRSPASTAVTLYMLKATQVEVNIGFNSSDSNFYIGSGNTNVGTTGVYLTNSGNSWSSVSDERMKTIVAPIENASAKVATLRTVIGYFNNDTKQTLRPFLIAQDVQAVLPEAVSVQDSEAGTLGMSYTDTIPLLVAAIKEQQALITSLTARIAALEGTPA